MIRSNEVLAFQTSGLESLLYGDQIRSVLSKPNIPSRKRNRTHFKTTGIFNNKMHLNNGQRKAAGFVSYSLTLVLIKTVPLKSIF